MIVHIGSILYSYLEIFSCRGSGVSEMPQRLCRHSTHSRNASSESGGVQPLSRHSVGSPKFSDRRPLKGSAPEVKANFTPSFLCWNILFREAGMAQDTLPNYVKLCAKYRATRFVRMVCHSFETDAIYFLYVCMMVAIFSANQFPRQKKSNSCSLFRG